MPFTFAHPSIILPLTHPALRLSATALIIGSIIPDFVHLMTLSDKGKFGHTWMGVIVFNLPAGFLLAYVYHYAVKELLINHLPYPLYIRLAPFKSFSWSSHVKKNFLFILLSFLIGIVSHFAWDTFTHFDPDSFKKYPFMLYPVRFSPTYVVGLFVLIWYISSVAGVLVIAIVIYQLPKAIHVVQPPQLPQLWKFVLGVFLMLILLRSLIGSPYENFPQVVIVGLGGLIWSVILVSLAYKFKLLTK